MITLEDQMALDAQILLGTYGQSFVHIEPSGAETAITGQCTELAQESIERGAVGKRTAEFALLASVPIVYEAPAGKNPSMIRKGAAGDVMPKEQGWWQIFHQPQLPKPATPWARRLAYRDARGRSETLGDAGCT